MSYKRGKLRVHDLIKIVQPIRYIRCGSTISPKEIRRDFLKPEHCTVIDSVINFLGLSSLSAWFKNKIYDAFAVALMKVHYSSEMRRELVTESAPELAGLCGIIVRSEWVKTGQYPVDTRRRLENMVIYQVLWVEVTDNCPLYQQVVTVLADHVVLLEKNVRPHFVCNCSK